MVLDIQLNQLGFVGIIVLAYVIYSLSEIRKDVSCMHDHMNEILQSLDAIGNMMYAHMEHLGIKGPNCCDEADLEMLGIPEDIIDEVKAWDEQD